MCAVLIQPASYYVPQSLCLVLFICRQSSGLVIVYVCLHCVVSCSLCIKSTQSASHLCWTWAGWFVWGFQGRVHVVTLCSTWVVWSSQLEHNHAFVGIDEGLCSIEVLLVLCGLVNDGFLSSLLHAHSTTAG